MMDLDFSFAKGKYLEEGSGSYFRCDTEEQFANWHSMLERCYSPFTIYYDKEKNAICVDSEKHTQAEENHLQAMKNWIETGGKLD